MPGAQGRRAEPVGLVVGDSRPDQIVFSVDPSTQLSLYDYVYVEVEEVPPGSDEPRLVRVLAQVRGIRRYALGFEPDHPWQVLRSLGARGSTDTIIAYARILGYRWGRGIYLPRRAPQVGSWVFVAPDEMLEEFFSVDPSRRLHIGYLLARPAVSAYLDIEGLKRHVAIIAATGAGKTWASIVLIEELLKKGATVLVLDPHGEYVALRRSVCRLGPQYCGRAVVLRARRDQEGDAQYRVSVGSLSPEELASVAGVPAKASRIRSVIGGAKRLADAVAKASGDPRWRGLKGIIRVIHAAIDAAEIMRSRGSRADISGFAEELVRRLSARIGKEEAKKLKDLLELEEGLARGLRRLWFAIRKDTDPAYDAVRYLEDLRRLGVYGVQGTPLDTLLRPGTVTVVNLAGLRGEVQDHLVYNILSRVFAARVRHQRGLGGESYPYPVVVVVEEAHRFMPPKTVRQTRSREVAAMIASEGRKFGVYMVAITQRPSRIDADVLSQLQGQVILRIVNPRDQDAVRDASEQMSQELLENLPGLNTGEAVVVGPLVPAPLMVRLRDRVLEYSGSDISLVEAWSGSLEDLRLVEEYRESILAKLNSLLGAEHQSLHEALEALLGRPLDPGEVEAALRLLAKPGANVWASYDEAAGIVYGEAEGREARIDLQDGTVRAEDCPGPRPCRYALAVLLEAIEEGIVVPRSKAENEPYWQL